MAFSYYFRRTGQSIADKLENVDLTPGLVITSGSITIEFPSALGPVDEVNLLQTMEDLGYVQSATAPGVVTKTANYTITTDDHGVLVNATTGPVTITLPPVSRARGLVFHVSKRDPTGNVVTLAAAGGDTINGQPSQAISVQYTTITIQAPDIGTDWVVT